MRRLSFLLLTLSFVIGCVQPEMTADQKATEIEAIKSQITKFFIAYEVRDVELAKSVVSPSGDFHAFGTDAAEVMRNQSDFEKQVEDDLKLFESVKTGELKNLSVQISNNADLASAYYEIPVVVTIGGETSKSMLRFAQTFRKENGEWRMVQSIASSPSTGQSSAELVQQKQTSKE